MKTHTSQSGFTPVHALLLLVLLSIIGFTGWKVYYNKTENNTRSQVSDNQTAQPTNFSECIRAGGNASSLTVPYNPHHEPVNNDVSADTLRCTYQNRNFPTQLNTSCTDNNECAAIVEAARKVCSSEFGVAANTLEPTFMYNPVIQNDFARLQLTDCSRDHHKLDIRDTVIMRKNEAGWQIFKAINSTTTCKDVDGLGIPLELLYICIDPDTGFRPPAQ